MPSPARNDPSVLVIRGFGKSYGCTGWRLGYAARAGPHYRSDEEAAAVRVRLSSDALADGDSRRIRGRPVSGGGQLRPAPRYGHGGLRRGG